MKTTKKEIIELQKDGWVLTDPSCNQMRKEIVKDNIYQFREDRLIDPISKTYEVYEDTLNYYDYDWWNLVDSCRPFGYTRKQVDKWITERKEIALMLECIFEQSI